MKLLFLRHGDALNDPKVQDSDRPLSDLGHRQAKTAAHYLKKSGHQIKLIVSSPLLRVRQTADHVAAMFINAQRSESEYLVSGSNPIHLVDLLNRQPQEQILLVGHEPHLSNTISLLVAGSSSFRIEMKKASLACLEVRTPLQKEEGLLCSLLTFDQMLLMV